MNRKKQYLRNVIKNIETEDIKNLITEELALLAKRSIKLEYLHSIFGDDDAQFKGLVLECLKDEIIDRFLSKREQYYLLSEKELDDLTSLGALKEYLSNMR